jgi:flavin-dependent dehydrogenase
VKEFGLEDSILQNYNGFIHHSPLGACSRFDFGQVALASLDYKMACNILFERSVKNGLAFIRAQAVGLSPSVPQANDPLTIQLNNGTKITTAFLVDASGYTQWAAHKLNIRTSTYYSHCYGEYLTGCLIEDSNFFRFLGPAQRYGNGGGWLYPLGKDSASIGYSAVAPTPAYDSNALISCYAAAKREFSPYADWVSSGVRVRTEHGIVPVGRIGSFFADRVLITGDAAGQSHPWVVEGCRPALHNGRQCAHVVLQAFAKKRFDKAFLSSYERQWNRINRERFWRTASVAELTWNRSDEEWDTFIASLGRLAPEHMLQIIRDNQASWFQQLYAIAGYHRRRLVKRLHLLIQGAG